MKLCLANAKQWLTVIDGDVERAKSIDDTYDKLTRASLPQLEPGGTGQLAKAVAASLLPNMKLVEALRTLYSESSSILRASRRTKLEATGSSRIIVCTCSLVMSRV